MLIVSVMVDVEVGWNGTKLNGLGRLLQYSLVEECCATL